MIQLNNNNGSSQISGKRISLLDEGSKECPSKRMHNDPCPSLSKKLESIVSERAAANGSI